MTNNERPLIFVSSIHTKKSETMNAEVKLVYSNRHLAGTYQPTEIDEKKKLSNRLVSICGPYFDVITEDGAHLSFKGRRAFNAWAKNNDYVTDF